MRLVHLVQKTHQLLPRPGNGSLRHHSSHTQHHIRQLLSITIFGTHMQWAEIPIQPAIDLAAHQLTVGGYIQLPANVIAIAVDIVERIDDIVRAARVSLLDVANISIDGYVLGLEELVEIKELRAIVQKPMVVLIVELWTTRLQIVIHIFIEGDISDSKKYIHFR